jgi:hypothetical protein
MRLPCCLLLLTASALAAADDFKPEPGFEPLLNGKDLTGWRTLGSKDKPGTPLDGKAEAFGGRFKVKDGELVIDPAVKGDVRIETTKEFATDAVIKYEFFPDTKCNNDLFFRGQKFDLSKQNVKSMKEGEWNPVEIAVAGGKVEFKVNGEVVRSAKAGGTSTLGIRAEFGAVRIRHLRAKG